MAVPSEDRSKYRKIVDQIAFSIHNGDMVSGELFLSRQEICDRYGISPVTAFKVQRELRELGYLNSSPGKEFIVNYPTLHEVAHSHELRKVRIIGTSSAIGDDCAFGGALVRGIREECKTQQLEFEREFIEQEGPPAVINCRRRLAPDEGLVLMLYSWLLPEVVALLLNNKIRSVIVNSVFPNRPAVLTDNFHGIGELLRNAAERGSRRILYAGGFSSSPVQINESERLEAFQIISARSGLQSEIDYSGNYHELIERIKKFRPDTILFCGDDPALHFRAKFLNFCGRNRPRILGFDDISMNEAGLETLTTYRIDCVEMGRCAVRQLLKGVGYFQVPVFERVKGQLVVRD